MITLFACPKPFIDPHIRLIQRNAIASWLALRPRPTVILFGDEEGVAETAVEFGVIHVPNVAKNSFGTPLLNDIFGKAETLTSGGPLCYVNADIILMDDFCRAIEVCLRRGGRWLMGGRPWDLRVHGQLEMEVGWQNQLSTDTRIRGVLRWKGACDYFAFPVALWRELPPFILGRSYFDNALLFRAREEGAALIDTTACVTAVHQNHDYASSLSGTAHIQNPEAQENIRLAGGLRRLYTWNNATHRLDQDGVRRWWPGTLRIWGHYSPNARRCRQYFWYPLLAVTKPVRRALGLNRDWVDGAIKRLCAAKHLPQDEKS